MGIALLQIMWNTRKHTNKLNPQTGLKYYLFSSISVSKAFFNNTQEFL